MTTERESLYPHGDTVCAGCHDCQPEQFPNTSAAYCGCHVCQPFAPFVHFVGCPAEHNRVGCDCRDRRAT